MEMESGNNNDPQKFLMKIIISADYFMLLSKIVRPFQSSFTKTIETL